MNTHTTTMFYSGDLSSKRPFNQFIRDRWDTDTSSAGCLCSYLYLQTNQNEANRLKEIIMGHKTDDPSFKPYLMVDSGAYSAHTLGKAIKLDEYIAFCHKLQRKMPSAIYINLDVISGDDSSARSYANWKEMRRQGLNPMPVYHLHSDRKWLFKYMRQTDYIGIGAVTVCKTMARKRDALTAVWEHMVDADRMPKLKVHGLAVTAFELMRNYPWYSVDSTSWLQQAIFGKILIPHSDNGKYNYLKKPHSLDVSSKSPKANDREHIANLRPLVRRQVEKYVQENGYDLAPLAEDTYGRLCLNALFYNRFTKLLTWPRPLLTTNANLGDMG